MMAVQGLQALNRKLRAMPVAARQELEKAVNEGAARVATLASALAPKDTGLLASTVRVEAGAHSLQKLVVVGGEATEKEVRKGSGAEFDYAKAQEWGTKEMEKNPSLYPAFRTLKKSIRARMNRAVRKAIKAGGSNA
ncbi:HK97-gp10 family putative phage morphogenesis protein [Mesorhizobium sp. IMUNJ 23232]|uniref:HK97-gp10 family putative phage morphogenesis protein n=1 Tax=Mesorhizobium sp. IMUNJ 23232 TaxID=3376064 RepID=UPI0037AD718A